MKSNINKNIENKQRKRLQTESTVYRQLVLASILVNNFDYIVIFENKKRTATKTISYFPIKYIIKNDILLFNSMEFCEFPKNRRVKYSQNATVNYLIDLLTQNGYLIETKQTKKVNTFQSDKFCTTLTKVLNIQGMTENSQIIDMKLLENTLGKDLFIELEELFASFHFVALGNEKHMEKVLDYMRRNTFEKTNTYYKNYHMEEKIELHYYHQNLSKLNTLSQYDVEDEMDYLEFIQQIENEEVEEETIQNQTIQPPNPALNLNYPIGNINLNSYITNSLNLNDCQYIYQYQDHIDGERIEKK